MAPPLPSPQNSPTRQNLSVSAGKLSLACLFLCFCTHHLEANPLADSPTSPLFLFFPSSFMPGRVFDFDGPIEGGQTWYLWQVEQQAHERRYLFWVTEDDASGQSPAWRLLRPRLLRVTAQQIYLDQLCLLQTPLEPGRSWSSTFWTGEAVQVELLSVFTDEVEIVVTQLGSASPKRLLQLLLKKGYGVVAYSLGEGFHAEFSRYWITRIGQLRAGPVPSYPVETVGPVNMVEWQVVLAQSPQNTQNLKTQNFIPSSATAGK